MDLPSKFARLMVAVAAAAVLACCPQPGAAKPWSAKREEPRSPSKIIATWTDTVLYQPNQAPRRGFGARIMFHDAKEKDPMKVEGALVVYAFDEDGRDPRNVKPDRKYVFTKEQFAKHYSMSSIGHSYSVWIPWDEVGGPQKQISLIVRFVPEKGDVLVGEQTKQLLPGRVPETARLQLPPAAAPVGGAPGGVAAANGAVPIDTAAPADGVRVVSHEENARASQGAAEALDRQKRRMGTATIAMPSQYGRPATSGAARPPINSGPQGWPAAAWTPNPATPGQSYLPEPPQGYPSQAPQQPQAWPERNPQPTTPPQARSSLAKPRVLGEPLSRLPRDRAPWQPHPAASPYRPGPTPSTASGSADPASPSSVGPGPN